MIIIVSTVCLSVVAQSCRPHPRPAGGRRTRSRRDSCRVGPPQAACGSSNSCTGSKISVLLLPAFPVKDWLEVTPEHAVCPCGSRGLDLHQPPFPLKPPSHRQWWMLRGTTVPVPDCRSQHSMKLFHPSVRFSGCPFQEDI